MQPVRALNDSTSSASDHRERKELPKACTPPPGRPRTRIGIEKLSTPLVRTRRQTFNQLEDTRAKSTCRLEAKPEDQLLRLRLQLG